MIDLHTHSTASDGSFTPRELIALAAELGITAIALTDHDSVNGIPDATDEANIRGIQFIAGVELDIEWSAGEFHLLGMALQKSDSALESCLERLNIGRARRNFEIIQKMQGAGFKIDMASLELLAAGGTIGRPHLARLLVEHGYAKDIQQAFDRYLGKGRPFYIERKSLELGEAICAINESGGVPVLAHPMSLYVSRGRLASIVPQLAEAGIKGLEAWHPSARVGDCEFLERLAVTNGLFVTAGSDFHGKARPDRKLGRTAGSRPIDDRYLPDCLLQGMTKTLLF